MWPQSLILLREASPEQLEGGKETVGWAGSGHPVGSCKLLSLSWSSREVKVAAQVLFLVYFSFIKSSHIQHGVGSPTHEGSIHKTKTLKSHLRKTHTPYAKSLSRLQNFTPPSPIKPVLLNFVF